MSELRCVILNTQIFFYFKLFIFFSFELFILFGGIADYLHTDFKDVVPKNKK